MSMPTGSETPLHGEPASYGVVPAGYGTPSQPSVSYGIAPPAPAPYSVPAPAPAPNAAPEGPFGPADRATLRSQFADDLRQIPRSMWQDFQAAALELLANIAVAAVIVGVFALVGYAIGGSTGTLLAGLLGVGVFTLLRFLVYLGMFVWGLGWLAKAVLRP